MFALPEERKRIDVNKECHHARGKRKRKRKKKKKKENRTKN